MNKPTEQTVRELIAHGESESVEFKRRVPDPSTLVKNISALANTHGGTILVGIQEPNLVVGTNPDAVVQIVERSREVLSPTIDLDVTTVIIDSKPIVVVSVPESQQIIMANGMALKRTGSQNLALTPSEISAKMGAGGDTSKFDRLTDAVSRLTNTVEQQSQTIDDLRRQQESANSPKSKAIDFINGGVVGTILGAIATMLIGG